MEEAVMESSLVDKKIIEVVMMMSADEMVAKSIAPVKKQFICPPPTNRTSITETTNHRDKKSKRQLKRDRIQEKKSALHICPTIAKTSNVTSCPHNDNCRFSHDLEAFLLQKPQDLEGVCPFLSECPYGIACRFAGTHAGTALHRNTTSEINLLEKDVQRLLWKNNMTFPKADATLKLLGLLGPAKNKINGVSKASADCCKEEEEDIPNEADKVDDVRPPKKTKCFIDDHNADKLDEAAGQILHDKDVDKSCEQKTIIDHAPGDTDTDKSLKLHTREKKLIDFSQKLYLAPLTTVGNLPYRRLCKLLGADVTCGEMAMCTNLLQGQAAEWALLRRHSSEDFFGVQICGSYSDTVARTVELIEQHCTVDFIDINMGCPIDIVVNKGAGSGLLTKPMRMKSIVEACSRTVDTPMTIKVRTGYFEGKNRIDSLIADIGNWGATAVTIHGRTRQQRYSKPANWDYVYQCARAAPSSLQVLGNGDVFSYLDWNRHKSDCPELSTCMVAREALVKPWIFTEIKEQRHWDISSGERLNILKDYVRFGWNIGVKIQKVYKHME